ncbi:hypothetical protein I204_07647 [Kwoniella mangroviensis CBS 8886]|nr:hypothetical protein I204_07647 [Kwoniella mangroviensis CBS 8886]
MGYRYLSPSLLNRAAVYLNRQSIPAPGTITISRHGHGTILSPRQTVIRSFHTTVSICNESARTSAELPFFHYRDYPNPPKVVYTSCPKEANKYLSQLKGPALGLDLEWTTFPRYRRPISLIQLCDEDLIVVFQLGEDETLPEQAIKLIEDPRIYKFGIDIKGDLYRLTCILPGDKKTNPASFLELSRLARMVEPEWRGKGRRFICQAAQSQQYLGKALNRDDHVRYGNWDVELKEEAIEYAANDVYSSLKIYDKLIGMSELKKLNIVYPYLCVDLDPPRKSRPYSFPTEEELEAQYNAPPIKYTIAGREFEHPAWVPKPLPSEIRAFEAFLQRRKSQGLC